MHPIREPIRSGLLPVSDIHQIYWEESGNPDGLPVIFLHGGPGAGASPACRGFFNPDVIRIVIIDQRGCGRSRPHAEVEGNTTRHLIDDLVTTAPPKDREVEAAKARERAALRYAQ